ncbi:MAG: hypothetical protein ABIP97_04585 [Chthoniobacterales bacterium]
MTRLAFFIFSALFFITALSAQEAAKDEAINLTQWVQRLNKLKSSCYNEWGAWRNVNKERLGAFQSAALASPALSGNRDVKHNMIAIVNSLVASQADFENAQKEYEKTRTQKFTDTMHWRGKPQDYRTFQLDLIKQQWTHKQENSSTTLQIHINALQRLALFNESLIIPSSDPVISRTEALEAGNEQSKKRAAFLTLSTEIRLEIVAVQSDGVIARVLDEHATQKKSDPLDSSSAHRYSASTIFITDVPDPTKGGRVICRAAPNGSYRSSPNSPNVMEKWIALETCELIGK